MKVISMFLRQKKLRDQKDICGGGWSLWCKLWIGSHTVVLLLIGIHWNPSGGFVKPMKPGTWQSCVPQGWNKAPKSAIPMSNFIMRSDFLLQCDWFTAPKMEDKKICRYWSLKKNRKWWKCWKGLAASVLKNVSWHCEPMTFN